MTTALAPTARDLARTDVRTIATTATLAEAAEAFAGEWVGLLLVEEHERLVGVLSERDVVRAVGEGEDVAEVRVEEYMTDDVLTVAADADLRTMATLLRDAQVRHLVLEGGTAVVSVRDVLAALLD